MMGIVIRKGFWTSFFAFFGAFLGLVNQLFIYPYFLEPNQIGLFSQIQSFATLVSPFALLGMSATVARYTPFFKEDKNLYKSFTSFLFIGASFGAIITVSSTLIFKDFIVSFYQEKSPLVAQYFELSIILIAVFTFITLNESIAKANFKVVIPNFLKDIVVRLLGLVLIILFGTKVLTFHQAIVSIIFLYIPSLIYLIGYNLKNGFIKISFDLKPILAKKKELFNYASHALLGSAGALIVLHVDVQMISAMLNLDATGIYTRAFYMAVMIEIPRRAVFQVVIPVISTALKNNDLISIQKLYRSLSLNLGIIGTLLFLGISVNLDNIYAVMNNGLEYKLGINVVYIIGISKLLDMVFSTNSEIILLSKYYKYNTVMIVLLSISSVFLNYFFIPKYGIDGAAYASLISIILFNTIKMILIQVKFKMMPFSIKHAHLLLVGGITWYIVYLIPNLSNGILDMVLRGSIVTIIFGGLIVIFRISTELNELVLQQVKKWIS